MRLPYLPVLAIANSSLAATADGLPFPSVPPLEKVLYRARDGHSLFPVVEAQRLHDDDLLVGTIHEYILFPVCALIAHGQLRTSR